MTINKEIEFNKIISDILKNKEFIKLKDEVHHGMNRLDHSLNVARTTFLWAKKLGWKNYAEVTRAALLHDFFTIEELHGQLQIVHPMIASEKARKYFHITRRQQNVIESHMFPISPRLPRYKESWLVSVVDKYCAAYECAIHKIPLSTGTLAMFILNFLVIQR